MNRAMPRPRAPGLFTALDMGRDQLNRPVHYFDTLGDTFEISVFGTRAIATREPAVFQEALVRQHKLFIKDEATRGLSKLLGQGLLTSEGALWRSQRRIIGPHFQPSRLEQHLPVFREEAERELARWVPERPFDLHQAMTHLSMNIALRTFFGRAAELADFDSAMVDAMLFFVGVGGTGMTLPLTIPTPANLRFLRARRRIYDALDRLLASERDMRADTSVLDSLLSARDRGELSQQQLRDEALTLLVAGHETSSLALTYTLALLADHPHEQRSVQEEVEHRFPDTLDAIRVPSALNRALQESFRLYPEAWAIGREALDDCELAGYAVSKGTQVFMYQWAAHRHPAYFDEPAHFRPGRWHGDFEANLPRCLYAPFGAGPRVCIGNQFALAEIVTVLATLLERFEFVIARPFAPALVPAVTLRPRDPVPVTVRPRHRARRAMG